MREFTKQQQTSPVGHDSAVRLVYERTSPPGEDSGVEPLIAVCADESEAEQVKEASSARGRYASWENHPVISDVPRDVPLTQGEIVHVVLLGGRDDGEGPEDPIGIAVYADREAAEQRVTEELRTTGSPGYHSVSLPVGWRAS